jgi:non-specific serine/threonine protein kinase
VSLTSFVGRNREIAGIVALLRRQGVRLVTLTGPGGVGKTRLALAVASEIDADFAGGTVFVPLAPIRDPVLVLPTVAQALGIREGADRPSAERLAAALAGNGSLLILDNLEQVLDVAPSVADLLAACPSLTILATSRMPLRISGEHQFPVSPLDLPVAGRHRTAEELGRIEAVALFVARAREHDPSFVLTAANAGSVATICRRLDGLPLAIELAAARVKVLSPEALEARLTERLRLLTGGAREQPPRLRSMRDAIAWSHDLLSPGEQTLFRRLGVFEGGFTLEAAEAVAGGQVGTSVLDALTALVDQSLVRRTAEGGAVDRYGMLETVREYAVEQLETSGEREDLRGQHAAYFADLAGRQEPTWWLPAALAGEQPNVRAATAWALDRGATELLVPLAIALVQYLEPAADYSLLELAATALSRVPPVLPDRQVLLLSGTAQFASLLGEGARASALVDQCADLAGEVEGSPFVGVAMLVLALVARDLGELERSEAFAADALRRWQRLGQANWIGEALDTLGRSARARGDLDRAEALLLQAVEVARVAGPITAVAMALSGLGACALDRGDDRRAAALFGEALPLFVASNNPTTVEGCLTYLGFIAGATGRATQAARVLGAAEARSERNGLPWSPATRAQLAPALERARGELADADFAAAWAAGRELPLPQAATEALAVAQAILAEPAPEKAAGAPARPRAAFNLTPRESDVLALLAEGRSDREIGKALFISPKTAGLHVTHILGKLGVSSRAAAVAFAHRHGFV